MLNAAAPRAGISIPEASRSFEPETANLSLSLGVPKGIFSFAKENIPFDSAARTPHIPPRSARKATAPPRERKKEAALSGCHFFTFHK